MKNFDKLTVLVLIAVAFVACGNFGYLGDPNVDATPQSSDAGVDAEVGVDSAPQEAQADAAAEVAVDASDEADADIDSDAAFDANAEAAGYVPVLTVELEPDLVSQDMYFKKYAEVLRINPQGDSKVDLTIDELCFTHTGSGSIDEISSVVLIDEDFSRLSMNDPVPDPVTGRACFSDLNFKIQANTRPLFRLVSLNQAIVTGGEHAFSIAVPGDVVTVESVVQVKGQFPIQGPTMTMSDIVPELIYSYAGTSSDLEFEADELDPSIYEFNANALRYQMHANAIPVFVVSRDGGLIRGSKGTFYLDRFQIWEGNVPIGDPIELDPTTVDVGVQGVYFSLYPFNGTDIFIFPPGITKKLYVTFSHPMAEDAPGEFFGHKYRLEQKLPGTYKDVLNYDFADLLDPGQVWPQSDIQGSLRRILAP